MDWQQAGALTIVAFTALLFVRGAILRRKRGTPTCGGNCSCTTGGRPESARALLKLHDETITLQE
jgi:hypothetical protein